METPWTIAKRLSRYNPSWDAMAPNTARTTISSLPLEICTQIASYLSSTAIMRLTLTCRAAYQLFNPALYHAIHSSKHSGSLLRTLSLVPSLAHHIRSIHVEYVLHVPLLQEPFLPDEQKEYPVSDDLIEKRNKLLWIAAKAIDNLFGPKRLQCLIWQSNVPFDLITTNADPVVWPLPNSIVKFAVIPIAAYMPELTRFEVFSQTRCSLALTHFEYREKITDTYDDPPVLLSPPMGHYRDMFVERLQDIPIWLPFLSKRLRTLKLTFNFNYPAEHTIFVQPHLDKVIKVINDLRFPYLNCLVLFAQVISSDVIWQDPDFEPFLNAHPTVTDLAIETLEDDLPEDSLPNLARFEGIPCSTLSVMSSNRPLVALKIWMPYIDREPPSTIGDVDDHLEDLLPVLASTPTLRDLSLTPETIRFSRPNMFWGERFMADVPFIMDIAEACPFLTRLELYAQRSAEDTLIALSVFHCLEGLKLHFWHWIESSDTSDAEDSTEDDAYLRSAASEGIIAENTFSKTVYNDLISRRLLPSMPDLKTVEIESLGCLEPARWSSLFKNPARPQIAITYEFMVTTELGERVVRCLS